MLCPPLDDAARATALQRALRAAGQDCELAWVAQTGSTNADLLARVRDGAPGSPLCLVAGHQTAGRGRRSRAWSDEPGSGGALLCSLAWPLARGSELAGLSLAVGVWLVQALDALGAPQAALKWPNDILLSGRKLAGVLVEVADTAAARWAVIGIGLNLGSPPQLPQAAGLHEHGVMVDRWQVLQQLLPRLAAGLQEFARLGFAPWTDFWNRRHAWSQRTVRVLGDGTAGLHGLALGVDSQGYLWLQTPNGRERVTNGDVSLRPETP